MYKQVGWERKHFLETPVPPGPGSNSVWSAPASHYGSMFGSPTTGNSSRAAAATGTIPPSPRAVGRAAPAGELGPSASAVRPGRPRGRAGDTAHLDQPRRAGAAAARPGAPQSVDRVRALPALPAASCTCPAALRAGGTRARGGGAHAAAALTCRTRRLRSAAFAQPQGARPHLGRRGGPRRTDPAPLRGRGRTPLGAAEGEPTAPAPRAGRGARRSHLPQEGGATGGARGGEGPERCGAPWSLKGLSAGCPRRSPAFRGNYSGGGHPCANFQGAELSRNGKRPVKTRSFLEVYRALRKAVLVSAFFHLLLELFLFF